MNRKSLGLFHQGGQGWIAGVNYIHNLIGALDVLPPEEKIPLYLLLSHREDLSFHKELKSKQPPVKFFAYRQSDYWRDKLDRSLESICKGRRPASLEDLAAGLKMLAIFPLQYSLGREFPVPWIGWIPDFQHKHMPQFFSPKESEERDRRFAKLIKEAPRVVVSSRHAYQGLLRWFPVSENNVSVFPYPSVADPAWYEDDPAGTAARFSLPEKFLIFPSQFWTHKNHRVVFEALGMMKNKGCNNIALVCTGYQKDYRSPEHFENLQKLIHRQNLSSNVHILGLLPRRIQIQLFRRSAAVIQPSLFEGWSFLAEDARTLAKRIYLSDIEVHREQNPPDAVYFNPENAAELAQALLKDWDRLSPGPDRLSEENARTDNAVRAGLFAKSFLDIVQLAVQAHSNRK